jgi:hypothetical protein
MSVIDKKIEPAFPGETTVLGASAPCALFFYKATHHFYSYSSKKRKKKKKVNTFVRQSAKKKIRSVLIKLLTFFAQRIRLKHNTWLKPEVSIVETLSSRDI